MFRQAFCQDKIDILPDLSLSGFRDCQFRTGRDRYSCNNLPAILIDKTGLLMIRFEFLITDDLFDLGNDYPTILLNAGLVGAPCGKCLYKQHNTPNTLDTFSG